MTGKRYNRALKARALKQMAEAAARRTYEYNPATGWREPLKDPVAIGAMTRAVTLAMRNRGKIVVMQLSEREALAFPSQRGNEPGGAYALAITVDRNDAVHFCINGISVTTFHPPGCSEEKKAAAEQMSARIKAARAEEYARDRLAKIMEEEASA